MLILAIETTGPNCSVALLDNDSVITEIQSEDVLNHLQTLTPMIEELMKMTGHNVKDMDRIAVSVGPGSFTGIRIGVSTARALSQVTGIKLTAVPTLFAFGCGERDGDKVICPVFDARRNQVYAGAYRDCEEIVPGGPYMLDGFLEKMEPYDDFYFIGDGLNPYEEAIKKWAADHDKKIETGLKYQTAGYVAEMAADMQKDPETFGNCLDMEYEQLEPNYMRMAEAERKLKEKK